MYKNSNTMVREREYRIEERPLLSNKDYFNNRSGKRLMKKDRKKEERTLRSMAKRMLKSM